MDGTSKDHTPQGNPDPERQDISCSLLSETPRSKFSDMSTYSVVTEEPSKRDHCRVGAVAEQQGGEC